MADENKKPAPAPAKATTEAVKKTEGKLKFTQRVAKWFRDMKGELKKVIWPTSHEIVKNTGVALGMMAVSAVVLWGFDKLASLGVETLIRLVG